MLDQAQKMRRDPEYQGVANATLTGELGTAEAHEQDGSVCSPCRPGQALPESRRQHGQGQGHLCFSLAHLSTARYPRSLLPESYVSAQRHDPKDPGPAASLGFTPSSPRPRGWSLPSAVSSEPGFSGHRCRQRQRFYLRPEPSPHLQTRVFHRLSSLVTGLSQWHLRQSSRLTPDLHCAPPDPGLKPDLFPQFSPSANRAAFHAPRPGSSPHTPPCHVLLASPPRGFCLVSSVPRAITLTQKRIVWPSQEALSRSPHFLRHPAPKGSPHLHTKVPFPSLK